MRLGWFYACATRIIAEAKAFWARYLEVLDEYRWSRDVPNTMGFIIDTWTDGVSYQCARSAAARAHYDTNMASSRCIDAAVERSTPRQSLVPRSSKRGGAVAQILSKPATVTKMGKKGVGFLG